VQSVEISAVHFLKNMNGAPSTHHLTCLDKMHTTIPNCSF
jgi:hypothetical protein